MNQAEAFRSLEETKRLFLARIPASASRLRASFLKNQLEDTVEAAGRHLHSIYESGFEVGPDFSALPTCEGNPKYAFWLEGIHRHLQNGEAVLADQPS